MALILSGDTGVPASGMPTGSVIQTVTTSKTNIFTSSTTQAWTDITGLSVTITPISTTSKILIVLNIGTARSGDNGSLRLVRNSTPINIGDANATYPNDTLASLADLNATNSNGIPVSTSYLDSPATTSAITYKIQFWINTTSIFINEGASYTDNQPYRFLTASSITAMEIHG